MAKTDYKTVDEFIAAHPEDVQDILRKLRLTILEAVPDAEEVISYQLPAYRNHGFVMYFSAHAQHYSISVPPPTGFEKFAKQLSPFKCSVSTVQFPKDKPIPFDLIAELAKLKAEENIKQSKKR